MTGQSRRKLLSSPKVEMKENKVYLHVILESDPKAVMNPDFLKFLETNREKLEGYGQVVYQGMCVPTQVSLIDHTNNSSK